MDSRKSLIAKEIGCHCSGSCNFQFMSLGGTMLGFDDSYNRFGVPNCDDPNYYSFEVLCTQCGFKTTANICKEIVTLDPKKDFT